MRFEVQVRENAPQRLSVRSVPELGGRAAQMIREFAQPEELPVLLEALRTALGHLRAGLGGYSLRIEDRLQLRLERVD